MTICGNCGNEIPPARVAALPKETWCKDCVEKDGDVERITGVMIWEHKTAPELYMGPGVKAIRAASRRGNHANLPFTSYENPFLQKSRRAQVELQETKAVLQEKPEPEFDSVLDGTSRVSASCHPERPKVSPDGKCLECCLDWYARRKTHA